LWEWEALGEAEILQREKMATVNGPPEENGRRIR
jgi:hypothetical protein